MCTPAPRALSWAAKTSAAPNGFPYRFNWGSQSDSVPNSTWVNPASARTS